MTDLHTLANAISDSSPAIKRFAVAVADKLEAVAPPAQGKAWGIAPSYGSSGFNPAVDTQMVTYVALGTTCPRLPGNDAASLSARSHGFKRWVAWLTGDGSATPDQIVAYARKYPEAWVGFGNELNLNSAWKVADVAAKQVQVYQAVKAAGLPNKVGLSATATPASSAEHLSVLDWCKHLAAAGCVVGKGFDFADFHMYSGDPASTDQWAHLWTPTTAGESCVSVLGGAPFVMSEMGAQIGKDVTTAAQQATAATAWAKTLSGVPSCLGGMWFQAYDGSAWAGYGLIDGAGNHRPSYDAFKAAIAA